MMALDTATTANWMCIKLLYANKFVPHNAGLFWFLFYAREYRMSHSFSILAFVHAKRSVYFVL